MAYEHAARIVAREGGRETLDGGEGSREIAVGVGGAHHLLILLLGHLVVPGDGFVVVALLQGEASLEGEPTGEDGLALKVQSQDLGTIGIVALLDGVAVSIGLTELAKGKDMAERGVEAFNQKIGLDLAKLMVEVGRETEAIGALRLEMVGQDRDQSLATDYADMEVFVESLGGTEATRIGEAEVDVVRGIEAEVGTGREDGILDEVVLVEATAQQEAPLLVFPLILEVETANAHVLLEVAVVAEDDILEAFEIVLSAESEVGGHEEELVERTDILRTRHIGDVVGGAVGLGRSDAVFLCSLADAAIIALAGRGLEREIGREASVCVGRKVVVGEAATLDVMVCLLGDIGLMGSLVELVAATAILMDGAVLEAQFGIGAEAEVGVEAEGLAPQFGQLGVAIAVVVIALAGSRLAEGIDAGLVVVGDERDIARGHIVERT